ncbi:flavin reductase family protein [Marinisporobacter balticus]|uniref:Flavin reductase (DIM6/NTAB) family NADH-FMN oxidoreductase RutF n=1 Tax=Marinisporobacter balticus TaxID=2018667 RepID=A0A4R2L9G0_9FIRM|nr:flavin reductase family protein [Marinisporobacter balticus]TCO79398.1 flavin reductase (DIM6/NTAB) family NADH-FMN oxidoreductase RutF [Marinisporobacter balticus]
MEKQKIEFPQYTTEMIEILKAGRVLLVGQGKDGLPNPMTIAWGSIMFSWNKPIFVAMVRNSRYTYKLMEECDTFTVNFFGKRHSEAMKFCGTKSGRDYDKWKEINLTPVKGKSIDTAVIKEAMINMECKTIYKDELNLDFLEKSIIQQKYDISVNAENVPHTFYFGEIMDMYGYIPEK